MHLPIARAVTGDTSDDELWIAGTLGIVLTAADAARLTGAPSVAVKIAEAVR